MKCGTCEKIYVGQTGRAFEIRMGEHTKSFFKNDGVSHFAKHFLDFNNHVFSDEFKILHTENKGTRLDILEALEINKLKHKNILLNEQININNSPLLSLGVF